MKNKKASELTEEQRELFAAHFYKLDGSPEDQDTPCPWGCPWYHGTDPELYGETVEMMAENWLNENL